MRWWCEKQKQNRKKKKDTRNLPFPPLTLQTRRTDPKGQGNTSQHSNDDVQLIAGQLATTASLGCERCAQGEWYKFIW